MLRFAACVWCCLLALAGQAQISPPPFWVREPLRLPTETEWVTAQLARLTPDQKLAQFFIVAAYSNKNESYYADLEKLISTYQPGGLLFFQGTPDRQAWLTNRYQAISPIPLFVTLDAESGLGMRLSGGMKFPAQMTLGAIRNNDLIRRMGAEIGRQCRRIGVHINFAPVIDVNSNPANPIIGSRSFGADPRNVAEKGMAYARGLRQAGVLASAKHFPGHGDTQADSHHTLPRVYGNATALNARELVPFRALVADSIGSVLVGHLHVPAYEDRLLPASLSGRVINGLLRDSLAYKGLVITDAMNMQGVTQGIGGAEACWQAFLAGNDLILQPASLPQALERFRQGIENREITQAEIDRRVGKLLRAKYRMKLFFTKNVNLSGLNADLSRPAAEALREELYEAALTLVRNERKLLPFRRLDTLSVLSAAIGEGAANRFQATLRKYAPVKCLSSENKTDNAFFEKVLQQVTPGQVVVLSLHNMTVRSSSGFGIPEQARQLVETLEKSGHKVVVCVFGSPYALRQFGEASALLCGYEDDPKAQAAAAQALFGAIGLSGRLPVAVGRSFGLGHGLDTQPLGRISLGLPEREGVSSEFLQKIEELMNRYRNLGVFPGGQMAVVFRNRMICDGAFGFLKYDRKQPVSTETLYDVASVTKAAATLQAVMLLNEQGKIDLNAPVSSYLPELQASNKKNILVRDVLLHQAGLASYIPFYRNTLPRNHPDTLYYATRPDTARRFSLEIGKNLWGLASLPDSVWKWVVDSPLSSTAARPGYLYSDLGFVLMGKVVERLSGQPLDRLVSSAFYESLGMNRTTFCPLRHGFLAEEIAPTEQDDAFRHRLLQGSVHDQNAAVLGGVAGHAGLFSNAEGLAKLLQMNLQNGLYGQDRFLAAQTLPVFTENHSSRSHRGLGWDRNAARDNKHYISELASPQGFGHSGFTGTFVWADPVYELVIVFLSNRVHPSASNNRIATYRVRQQLMDAVYEAVRPLYPPILAHATR